MYVPQTEIIITKDGAELTRVTVKPGDYVLGSAQASDIIVPADGVADRHAMLTVNYHELFIEDLGGGSTSVAGSAVTKCTRLWPSQKVQIGSAVLETRRIKAPTETDLSLAPETEMVRQFLPAEFLREKKYDIGGLVAQGGMGEIVDAFEATTGRTVAMKVMLSSLSEDEILGFVAEAQITSQLEHPNIIPVHELGIDEEDHVFYTMKLVQGVALKQVLKKLAAGDAKTIANYPLAVLLTVFQKVCDAVAFAHSRTVIHRDLKPGNVTMGDYGEVLVMNWGQAKILGVERDQTIRQASGEEGALDPRVDVFALGAILYQILALQPPASDGPIVPLKVAQSALRKLKSGSQAGPLSSFHLPGGRIPESLAAVAMKALSVDPSQRYPSVSELQTDITAYQDGFATSAERASLMKQLVLLVGRHKRESAALIASVVALLALGVGAYGYIARERNVALLERQRAEHQRIEADRQRIEAANERTRAESERERADRTLSDLRTAAPAYHRQAAALIQAQKFDEALGSIGFAIALSPDDPDYLLAKANMLQAMQRLPEAVDNYRRVLAMRATDASAKTNQELCERLLAEAVGNPLSRSQQARLLEAIVAQKRTADGVFLASMLNRQADARLAQIKEQLGSVTKQLKWNDARLTKRDDGTFGLDLSNLALPDLSVLRDIPISSLNIARGGVFDLTPLAALPLTKLDCSGNPISDLSPLKSSPLKQLSIDSTQVTDLSPLKGMNLEELSLRGSAVVDLSPIQGMPLATLSLAGLPISSIEALRGMPLRLLDCFGCQQLADFSPLTTLIKLETLNLPAHFADLALVQKLSSLKRLGSGDFGASVDAFDRMPTVAAFLAAHGQRLALQNKLAPRLDQLRHTLRQLGAPEGKIATVTVSGDGFMDLDLTALPLDNLSPLSGLPVRRLVIKGTKISDLTPLRGLPLTALDASESLIKDLTPLAACPTLKALDVSQTNVADLRPLAALKLDRLVVSKTAVQDLLPLQRLPLRVLYFDETKVEDLRPLMVCTTLESLAISRTVRDPNPLRKLPSLLRISVTRDARNGQPAQSATEFWAEYDAGGKTREAEAKLEAALAKLKTLGGWKDTAFAKQPDGTYKFNLRGVLVTDLSPLRDLPISVLDITETAVSRLGPIVNCPIRELYMEQCVISDLSALGRLPLERIEMTQNGAGDLQHLRGLQLRRLRVVGRAFSPTERFIADLSSLKGMPLESLSINHFTDTEDLKALQDAPMKELFLADSGIKDLKPVRGMPLAVLDIRGTRVSEISPLRNLPLTRIYLLGADVRDVAPLADCKFLEEITLPRNAKGIETLRKLPNLKRISFEEKSGGPSLTTEEFWVQFDKQKKP